ncbi:hypothetical protein L1987_42288 [Smallanthus sonchifolius]|uniref:Uncharacterized protein n=1 Tax=Smallanthus sonchifolius TaxID=185202 RepID=A0ACB9GWV4_9ASTR|nr:hypothetical protein L1987_42288 [Smallanthus sonchifolius]
MNRLIISGVPATVEHRAAGVQNFITVMDSLKLNMSAVDQEFPLLSDLSVQGQMSLSWKVLPFSPSEDPSLERESSRSPRARETAPLMAEAHMPRKHSDDSVKLFVGQVPKHMTETQLIAMFKEFALVDEVNIIKDKATRASRGCCFVICPSMEEADKAVDAFHNNRTLPGASSPLQVKYADGELERLEHKLFIGMLPKNVSEGEVTTLLSQYGTLKDLQILRGASQQTSKGCAFVKYETKEQAVAAIEGLNGKHKMEGSTVPLVLKWADTEKERQVRKAQKAQSLGSTFANVDPSQHPSLFGALPMGYMSPYNGYGYQVCFIIVLAFASLQYFLFLSCVPFFAIAIWH